MTDARVKNCGGDWNSTAHVVELLEMANDAGVELGFTKGTFEAVIEGTSNSRRYSSSKSGLKVSFFGAPASKLPFDPNCDLYPSNFFDFVPFGGKHYRQSLECIVVWPMETQFKVITNNDSSKMIEHLKKSIEFNTKDSLPAEQCIRIAKYISWCLNQEIRVNAHNVRNNVNAFVEVMVDMNVKELLVNFLMPVFSRARFNVVPINTIVKCIRAFGLNTLGPPLMSCTSTTA